MKQLHDKVNIIPVIAKADTLTEEEIAYFKAQARHATQPGLRIRIRIDPDSIGSVDPDPDSESGSRRAKMTHKSR